MILGFLQSITAKCGETLILSILFCESNFTLVLDSIAADNVFKRTCLSKSSWLKFFNAFNKNRAWSSSNLELRPSRVTFLSLSQPYSEIILILFDISLSQLPTEMPPPSPGQDKFFVG